MKTTTRKESDIVVGDLTGGHAILYTDGACRGNPGPSSAGWVVYDESGKKVLTQGCQTVGRRTNNEAEYEAVILGLKAALATGARDVTLRSDSELLVRQMQGRYQVKNPRLAVLHAAARELVHLFRHFEAEHVRRENNSVADALANQALDNEGAKAESNSLA